MSLRGELMRWDDKDDAGDGPGGEQKTLCERRDKSLQIPWPVYCQKRQRENTRRARVGGWLAVGSEREKEISEIIANCSFWFI